MVMCMGIDEVDEHGMWVNWKVKEKKKMMWVVRKEVGGGEQLKQQAIYMGNGRVEQ